MNVVPAQTAGVGLAGDRQPAAGGVRRPAAPDHPGRRARCSASTRCTRSAARRRSRCSPTAAPTPTVPSSRRSTWSPARATSTSPRPSGSARSQVGIDAEAGPTEIAILADDTADPVHVAADLISQAEHDPMAASVLVTDSARAGRRRRGRARRAGARPPSTASGSTAALTGHAVGDRAGRRPRRRASRVVNAYAAEHLEIQTADARDGRRPGPQRRRDLRRRRSRRSASATTAPAPTTCCPPAGCARHSSGLSVQTFLQAASTSSTTHEAALHEVAGHVVTLAEAEDLPAPRRGGAAEVRARDAPARRSTLDDLPLREDLRGSRPTARRSSTCRCGSTSTRTRYPPTQALVDDIDGRRSQAVAGDLNRYPDRDAVALRTDLAAT